MHDFLEFISGLSPLYIFIALFIAAFVENIFPPVPGDTVTIFGGALVGFQAAGFANVYIATTIGSVAGFMALYYTGFRLGRQFFERGNSKIFHPENLAKLEKWFNKYGDAIIVINRFLAGTRSLVSVFAGISKRPWLRVAVLSTVSVLLWNGLLIGAGYYLGRNWETAETAVRTYGKVIMAVLALSAAAFFFYRKKMKPKEKTP
jgi:membrane protein DedA with SNARE-associated domain